MGEELGERSLRSVHTEAALQFLEFLRGEVKGIGALAFAGEGCGIAAVGGEAGGQPGFCEQTCCWELSPGGTC